MTLVRWNPMRDLAAMEIDRLQRMFDGSFAGGAGAAWMPAVDIYEDTNGDLVLTAEVPGLSRDDIRLTVENNVLTLEGERKQETDERRDRYHRYERQWGAFRRSFTLPHTLDAGAVKATCQDGVLTVRLPRREEAKPRQITIEG